MDNLKAIIVQTFSALLLQAQKGYPLQDYSEIIFAMESVNFIQNYTDSTSPYYLPTYRVNTIIDYHTRELTQL